MTGQNTSPQHPTPGEGVDQYVVLFPSAQQAAAFFAASTQTWSACSNQQLTINTNSNVFSVGPFANTNGILSAPESTKYGNGSVVTEQRALAVANNVVVDIWVGGLQNDQTSNYAAIIAQEIAAKVPT